MKREIMGKKNLPSGNLKEPQTITTEDRIRLREMLEFILKGTYFAGDEKLLGNMMKSDARVSCLKFIESMIVVNNTVDHNHISDFFNAYLDDAKSRMALKCKITNDFYCPDFSIGKNIAMKFCLIIGELVTNSLKHGLGSKRKMPLILSMGNDPDDKELFSLAYMDEGLGINENKNMSNKEQYGLSIAHSIMESLDGEFYISTFEEGGVGIECKIDKNKLQEFYN